MGIFTDGSKAHAKVKEFKDREAIIAAIRTQTNNSLSQLFEMFGEDFTLTYVDFDFSSSEKSNSASGGDGLELLFSFGVFPRGISDERAIISVDVVMVFEDGWRVKSNSCSLDLSSAGLYSDASSETKAGVLSAFWDEFIE